MSDPRKHPIIQFIAEIESVRLTNWSIGVAWKTSAGLVALTARLFASIVLAIVGIARRRRSRW